MAVISHMENNPLCLAVTSDYNEGTDLIIYGDDGGYVNVLTLQRRFLLENTGTDGPGEHLTPLLLMKKGSIERHYISLSRVLENSNYSARYIKNGYSRCNTIAR